MNHTILTALAAALAVAGCGDGNQQSISVGGGTTGNISQKQSGWSNSQSMSIGNVDGSEKPAGDKGKAGKVDSTQADPDTGNKQSAKVVGDAVVAQSQGGRNNAQSVVVDGSGNISQSQSGSSNSQSLNIGGGSSSSGTPSVTQTQTGANRTQSTLINGKKVGSSGN